MDVHTDVSYDGTSACLQSPQWFWINLLNPIQSHVCLNSFKSFCLTFADFNDNLIECTTRDSKQNECQSNSRNYLKCQTVTLTCDQDLGCLIC